VVSLDALGDRGCFSFLSAEMFAVRKRCVGGSWELCNPVIQVNPPYARAAFFRTTRWSVSQVVTHKPKFCHRVLIQPLRNGTERDHKETTQEGREDRTRKPKLGSATFLFTMLPLLSWSSMSLQQIYLSLFINNRSEPLWSTGVGFNHPWICSSYTT
jgi:hypothetical protein